MRFLSFADGGEPGLAIKYRESWRGVCTSDALWSGSLLELLQSGHDSLARAAVRLARGHVVEVDRVTLQPPIATPGKIVCVGLNYADHTKESALDQPEYPTFFARFASSLVAHGAPILIPAKSEQLDYEGELVAVIGRPVHRATKSEALASIAGWSIFNDASVRDYQFRTTQWLAGKNFDATGAFGPVFTTSDEIPPCAKGLALRTRLNGAVVQSASTSDMIFDAATLVSLVSEIMTLVPGDLVVTGTPAGVGFARKPPLWMKMGDIVEVEIEGLGILRNPVARETDVVSHG